jgi:hypothetical protein
MIAPPYPHGDEAFGQNPNDVGKLQIGANFMSFFS